ncbi:CCA tRNA nucleotidyltransferase [Maritalea mediterranea]|uniref:CCA tRNA nucleotidyltransferase n=1 Tax=Maritalea mediterranea TaxID=2909667 RepID=A0ABS9E870_9HYPH|nr:CCA tRNA nucleotidyltransferase [Maritalea mediterranea]MCF4099080.1 CCA tRNA nucleotidyltransferase [Maritalea mediterranea]
MTDLSEALARVKQASWLNRPAVRAVFDLLDGDQGHVRAVGGIVRNTILGDPVSDVDMASIFTPEEVLDRAAKAKIRAIPTGIEHGTVTLVFDDETIEVTTLRQDVATNGRHAKVVFGTDWEEDAKRRDFTMNALYVMADGTLFDPLNGVQDCLDRNVHFIGDAVARIEEDYLRILRFFRFFAYYGAGRPEAGGLKAAAKLKTGVKQLSAERVWAEFKKILSAPDPSRALLWMRTTGVLAMVLPEGEKWGMDAIHGVVAAEQELNWQIDPLFRLISIIPPQAEKTKVLADRLKLSNDEAARLHNWALQPVIAPETSAKELDKLLYWGNQTAILDRICLDLAALRQKLKQDENMELMGQIGALHQHMERAQAWTAPAFPIGGKDLIELGMTPGEELGKVLKTLEQYWVDKDFKPGREALLDKAKSDFAI